MARLSLENPEYYLNRDTSWLAFNERVLEEAEDTGNPLLERLKFLAISASNLDEFFEIRVAAMMQQIEDGYNEAGPDGLTLTDKREVLARLTHKFVDEQYECWNTLRPALAENGIRVLGMHELDAEARRFVDEYCEKELDPLLTPVTVDPAHPFPRVINKALCLGLLLRRRRRSALTYTGVVSVPRSLAAVGAAAVREHGGLYFSGRPGGAPRAAHVSRLRHCGGCALPGDAEQQSLSAGRRGAESVGVGAGRVAQPAQGRRGAHGN